MDVYVEYVVLDNLIINGLILLCVKGTLKLKCKWWNILLSSALGTIVAVVLPLFELSNWVSIPIKLFLGIIMTLCLTRYLKIKDFIFSFLLFIGYTLLLGGACMATLLAMGTSVEALAMGGYDTAVPLGIILLIVALYVYIIMSVSRYLTRKRVLSSFMRKVKVVLGGRELYFDGFIDSGNKLIDSKSGLPVMVISLKGLEKYFSKDQLESLMLMQGKGSEFKNVHTTSYNTISGEARKMVVFEADKLVIISSSGEYTTNRFVLGVTYKTFKDATHYDILLNPVVL